MNQLLQDIIKWTETGETISITRDSVLNAIDPIKEARGTIAEPIAKLMRDTDPWQNFVKWCECFNLEYREPHDNYHILIIRKKPISHPHKAFS